MTPRVGLLVLLAACRAAKLDLSAIDDCAPGMSDTTCQISATTMSTRQGGLRAIKYASEEAKARDTRVLDRFVLFSTGYDDVVAFMTKQVGAPAIRTHEVPVLKFQPTSPVEMWVTSDGTWVANREDMRVDWYSLPFSGWETLSGKAADDLVEAQSERPAPVSTAIWRALGRFLVEHPPVEQP